MLDEAGPSLPGAVAKLAAAKAEHRKILQQVAADPGMAPETRTALIEHLWLEEDEHVRRIAALAGAPAAAAEGHEGRGDSPRLTVGSLRPALQPGRATTPTTTGRLTRLGSLLRGR